MKLISELIGFYDNLGLSDFILKYNPMSSRIKKFLMSVCNEGLQRLNAKGRIAAQDTDRYQQRLDLEIALISKMGFVGYFLVVSDFIGWAHNNKIPVGPGRGSAAGSLVAWALQITDI